MLHSGIELITIGVYLLVLVAVGLVLHRQNSNVSDYFRNGCQGTWWLVGASAFMSSFSAWTFTGAAGVAYEAGWSVSIIFLANAAGFFINFLFLAPWFRQLRAITVPEVIRNRFGGTTQQVYAWFSVPTQLLFSALQLYGLAIFSASVFGLNLQAVILGVGTVVLIYSVVGGSWAVMSNDFLQTLVLVPMTVLLAVLCLVKVGGIDGFLDLMRAKGLSDEFAFVHRAGQYPLNAYTWAWAAAMFFQNVFAYNSLNSASRYFAVKDGTEARKAALLGAVLMLLGACIWFIPPMTARLLFEAEVNAAALPKPAEAAYAIASANLLPTGMIGLMVVAMFAATMSSMDVGLNRNAAIFTQDIYPALCRLLGLRQRHDRSLLRLGQFFSLGMGLTIIGLAVYFSQAQGQGIFEFMLNVTAMLGIPLATPMLLALFIRRVPWWSALFSTACGLVPSALSALSTDTWSFQQKVTINTVAGMIGFLATIPFWRYEIPRYKEQVAAFFKTMLSPIDYEREVGISSDLTQLKVIGTFAAVIGILVCLLALAPNPWTGRLQIVLVGGVIAAMGLAFMLIGRRRTGRHVVPGRPAEGASGEVVSE